MNSEQEVIFQIIASNPVLRLITFLLAKETDIEQIDLSHAITRDKTGLSDSQAQKAIIWLVRKGLLRQMTDVAYPRFKARYSLNEELSTEAQDWACTPFGIVGLRILQATARTFDLPYSSGGDFVLFSRPNGDVLEHQCSLMKREEAFEIKQAIDTYIEKYNSMSVEQFERHRKSHQSFLWWGTLLDPYRKNVRELRHTGTIANALSPLLCDCGECEWFHKLAFSSLTDYFNYEKQEKKQIRTALKSLD